MGIRESKSLQRTLRVNSKSIRNSRGRFEEPNKDRGHVNLKERPYLCESMVRWSFKVNKLGPVS